MSGESSNPPVITVTSDDSDNLITAQSKMFMPTYKLSNIPKLTSEADYQKWRGASEYVLNLLGCWEIMLGTETKPVEGTVVKGHTFTKEDVNYYTMRY
jgi:hypothetical protein